MNSKQDQDKNSNNNNSSSNSHNDSHNHDSNSMMLPIMGLSQHASLEWSRRDNVEASRHRADFIMLQYIGRGAFGVCQKVQNRVDENIYCLKSILIPDFIQEQQAASSSELLLLLREVQLLSSIKSDHVVRYFASWVEKGEPNNITASSSSSSSAEFSLSTCTTSNGQATGGVAATDPTCHLCQSTYKDWEVSFEHWGLIDSVLQPLDLCISCYKKSIPDTVDTCKISIRQRQQQLQDHLFILMEFCEWTLTQAVGMLSSCTNSSTSAGCGDDTTRSRTIWSYFCQCVQGVAHLHAQGVIHRDIKPSNIFVHDGVVKIGDLGLARLIGKNRSSNNNKATSVATNDGAATDGASYDDTMLSSQVGTMLYTAPEVATGSYNESCDVYSLGILLIEIFSTFDTAMERAKVLSNPVELAPKWVATHAAQAELVAQMTCSDPTKRPSCSQILVLLMQKGLWIMPTQNPLSSIVSDLSNQLVELGTRLDRSQEENARLCRLLDEHHIEH
jgi:eukaryotic translation initiation factor 2-alpha kinase 4